MAKKPIDEPIIESYWLKKNKLDFINEIISDPSKFKPYLPSLTPPRKDKPKSKQPLKRNPKEVLSPLDAVFFDRELMDELILHTSIPQLLNGELPIFRGVILFGPPGTGKSEFQGAVAKVYDNAGAYARHVSTSEINTCFVGEFAKNLERELQRAQEQGEERGLPSFVSFDEGSILAERASQGATSVSKHYQEAIDTMKRYIGNECGKNVVLAISTNQLPRDFEEAMTREGRLKSFLIGPPKEAQIAQMWKHFLGDYGVIQLNDESAMQLAREHPYASGAFIEEFARGYHTAHLREVFKEKGYSSLFDALKNGEKLSREQSSHAHTYEEVRTTLVQLLERDRERNGELEDSVPKIGFRTGNKLSG